MATFILTINGQKRRVTADPEMPLLWVLRHGFFHPASVEQLGAGLDGEGRVLAWLHKSVGSALSMFGLPSEEAKKDLQKYARDESLWGAFDTPYNFLP